MKAALLQVWKWLKWPLVLLLAAYVVLVVYRIVVLTGEEAVQEDVSAIHADRLEWSDINGDLPPAPDEAANDATLAGVDSNQNGIRDDVERAIYEKYKTQPRVALAMFQYAKALQKEFTHVYNSETLVAVQQEQSRGFGCVFEAGEEKIDETQELVFNSDSRLSWREDIRNRYGTSYALPNTEECDLEL